MTGFDRLERMLALKAWQVHIISHPEESDQVGSIDVVVLDEMGRELTRSTNQFSAEEATYKCVEHLANTFPELGKSWRK